MFCPRQTNVKNLPITNTQYISVALGQLIKGVDSVYTSLNKALRNKGVGSEKEPLTELLFGKFVRPSNAPGNLEHAK